MKILEQNVISIYGDDGKKWLMNLPKIISEISDAWRLSSLAPVDNLSYNYVLSGMQNTGTHAASYYVPIILKLFPNRSDLEREVIALKAFDGFGAAKVLNYNEQAILLEMAIPGNPVQSIDSCCEVMKKLHKAPIPYNHSLPHIRDQLKDLDKAWEIPIEYLQKARILRDKLLDKETTPVLLHGDLHRENILQHSSGFMVIDPKGVIGFPSNETWAFIADFEKDTSFVADYFGWDVHEIREGYFVHSILAAAWNIEDGLDPTKFIELAAGASSQL